MSDKINFEELAQEAIKNGYDPRAKRCWPWSHQWSMWARDGRHQSRRCIKCGKTQIHRIFGSCSHTWETTQVCRIYRDDAAKLPIGNAYYQACRLCGDVRCERLL